MEYVIYKLEFSTGVHFGSGFLNDSENTFRADTLFSALYMEALKCDKTKELYDSVYQGDILISDAFPYIGDTYMLPKPIIHIESEKKGDLADKKIFKNLKYIPVEQYGKYIIGKLKAEDVPKEEYGVMERQVMSAVRTDEETLPFYVGVFHFYTRNGLYIIVGYKRPQHKILMEELLKSLSYVGIGGKRGSGLGKFILKKGTETEALLKLLQNKGKKKILLSTALPNEDDLEDVLEDASYLLEKRSGFIASDQYADEYRKKKDLYVFLAGSCFTSSFRGDIIDVSDGGSHPVYRYAKAMFLEV